MTTNPYRDEILKLHDEGVTGVDIATRTGQTYNSVRAVVMWSRNAPPRRLPSPPPCDADSCHALGVRRGKPTDLPIEIQNRLMDEAVKGGTLWDAVGRLLA